MTEQTSATAVRTGMKEPTEFHAKCPPSYEELVHRLEVLEQQVAQMRDALQSIAGQSGVYHFDRNGLFVP